MTCLRFGVPLWLLAAACAPADDADVVDTSDQDSLPSGPTVVLFDAIGFVGHEDGTSEGFDLDGAVTEAGDATGCGKPDLVAPDGTEGVDNAFGALLPLIASLGGEALQSLVQAAVTSGELLLVVELDDLAGTPEGTCTTGRVLRGAGQPAIGTHGGILPGQTFDINPDQPSTDLDCVERLDDGRVVADGVVVRLPLHVFDETIDLTLTDGRLELVPTDTGWRGVIGGGVSVAELSANVLGFDAIPEELELGIVSAVELNADLAPDASGVCQQVSVTLGVSGIPAFLYEDAPR